MARLGLVTNDWWITYMYPLHYSTTNKCFLYLNTYQALTPIISTFMQNAVIIKNITSSIISEPSAKFSIYLQVAYAFISFHFLSSFFLSFCSTHLYWLCESTHVSHVQIAEFRNYTVQAQLLGQVKFNFFTYIAYLQLWEKSILIFW